MSNKNDPVSPEIRTIEHELDNAFKSNYLVTLNFAQAAWYLLATAEDSVLMPIIKQNRMSMHDIAADADRLLTHIQYPLAWLYKACPPNGTLPFDNREIAYKAAMELLDLAASYKSVVAAFTYATKGVVELKLEGNQIVANHGFLADSRYEAYNRLLKPSESGEPFRFAPVFDIVLRDLKVEGDRFEYKITPKIAENVKAIVRPVYESTFTLPLKWQFTRYSIEQYLEFAVTLAALAVIHWSARYLAAINDCVDLGYRDSVKIFDGSELISRITRYSSLSSVVVTEIIADLTYGHRGIKNPDPALQPLIAITKNKYALAPWLWLTNAVERNFTVLMNRMPSEQKIYAQLVNEKENAMRAQMIDDLSATSYRFAYGDIPQDASLPDIDLGVVSDAEKACLILELKWFIDPADIGEVITKTEDLQKGVDQMNRIRNRTMEGFQPLFDKLGIDASFTVGFAVVSANWIGFEDVQDANVPIINQRHLTQKIQREDQLLPVIEWLNRRSYLPTEGVEYAIIDDVAKIGDWKLKWYGIKTLIRKQFLPL